MMKFRSATCSLVLLIGWAFQSPVFADDLDAGKALFMRHCRSCHGRDARGNGSVSIYLNTKVPDLTLIKSKNNGIYSLEEVMSAIDGRREVRAHGERDMPVWGEVFKREPKNPPQPAEPSKVKLIAEYIGTLQR